MKKLILICMMLMPAFVLADAPVIDSTGSVVTDAPTQSDALPANQGLMLQQVNNLLQMNLPARIQQLQESIQDLRGMVEIQGHQIQMLSKAVQGLTGQAMPEMDTPVSDDNTETSAQASPIPQAVGTLSSTEQQQMTTANASPEATKPPVNLPAPAPSTQAPSKEQALYQAAYADIQSKHYVEAIDGLKSYLSQYPTGTFAPNAHYWLGELYMISGNNQAASSEFSTIVSSYAHSDKVPDAMLKLGLLAMSNQDYATAKKQFKQLIKQFPDNPAARIADTQLNTLARAGY